MTLGAISTPDQVETSIGTLQFIDGAPLPETAATVYDYLDRMRGVDAFLKGMPAASLHMLIEGPRSIGAEEAHQVVIFDRLLGPDSLFLTANSSTLYVFPILDLERDGPTMVEAPSGVLGAFNDAYFRYIGDVGPSGPDKGEGGKYLVLPPGYDGAVPEGYFVVRSPSYRVGTFMRGNIADGLKAAAEHIKSSLRVYPLRRAENPPEMEFSSGSGLSFNTIHANYFQFYEELNAVIQKEPIDLIDGETRGLFASIVWHPREDRTLAGVRIYPEQNWYMAFLDKKVFFNGPDGQENNWIQSRPGKSWFAILRMYGPLQPWFEQSWKPGDLQPVE